MSYRTINRLKMAAVLVVLFLTLCAVCVVIVLPIYVGKISGDFENHLFVMQADARAGEPVFMEIDGAKVESSANTFIAAASVLSVSPKSRTGVLFLPRQNAVPGRVVFYVGENTLTVFDSVDGKTDYVSVRFNKHTSLVRFGGLDIAGRVRRNIDKQ